MDGIHASRAMDRLAGLGEGRPREGNRLLRALPTEEYERLAPSMETVPLPFKFTLYEAGAPIVHVYFPQAGMISMISEMKDGAAVEVGTVGNEGMAGLPIFLGAETMPTRAFTQIPGEATRISAAIFALAADEMPSLQRVMRRYTQALLNQIAQSAACNRMHTIEERCARWLLMSHDRTGSDYIALTQEFLAEMLGVRRAGVTVAAGKLQKAGLIAYRRGTVSVLDREGLQAASCECYRIVREEYDRLIPPGTPS
ncbi:MAG: Crp/Fnr family transcriptional regulator [Gemmatimonadaceae bacterium]